MRYAIVLTGYIKSQVGDRTGSPREAHARLRADDPSPRRRQRLVQGAHSRQRRAGHRQHRAASPRRASRPTTAPQRDVDIVITATGFDIIKFLWPAEYVGVDGVRLHERLVERRATRLPQPDGAGVPQHVHALRAELSAGIRRHVATHLVPDLVAATSRSVCVEDDRGRLLAGAGHRSGPRPLQRGARHRVAGPRDAERRRRRSTKNYYVNEYGRMQVNAPFESPYFHEMCETPDWDDVKLS